MSTILAKPSGISLQDHVNNVLAEGFQLIEHYPLVFAKYSKYTGCDLAKRLEGACRFHDEGKKHHRWQSACRKDYSAFLEWQSRNGGSFHDYEKSVKNVGKNLMNAHVRHEIDSVVRHSNLPLPIQVAIGAHHGKLSRFHQNKWTDAPFLVEGGQEVWNRFELLGSEYILNAFSGFRSVIRRHYEYAGIRGLLQLADHRASIKENGALVPAFVPFQYHFPEEWTKRPVQTIAEENWEDKLLLIRAPTGAGKTSAALLWAKRQIHERRADRLVIAMPTRFTSNALAINITDSLSDTGLYHSSAWFKKFHSKAKEGERERHEARMEHEFARLLQTPVTVCTIDHLLMCLTLSREDHHTISFNLANSCLVIDEADFYDEFTQANILVLLEALNELDVPVMIMSASLPESCIKMYQSTGYRIDKIIEDSSDIERPRCEVSSIRDYEEVGDLSDLLNSFTNQPTIIYTNTVEKAVRFYDWFIENTVLEPMLYHSRFTEPDKLVKESVLLKNLGREAWENGTAKGVAIMTQIGEMSINISADVMLSDVCPIDRLVQRAGRLSRFDTNKVGRMHVLVPTKHGTIYPAPYGTYDRRQRSWTIGQPLKETLQNLEIKSYSARDFVQFINIVYDELEDFSSRAKDNARLLKESFAYNWIILPRATSELDETETVFWKSRDIDNQVSVLTAFPENPYFRNYLDWQSFKLEHGVNIPIYIALNGIANHKIERRKIYLNEDVLEVLCTYDGIYTERKGLYFEKTDRTSDQIIS